MQRFYEELAMNAWPAHQTLLYDGWVIRLADGYTRRANSVNPIYPSTISIEEKIEKCEKLFSEKGLSTTYKITEASFPENLDGILASKGYQLNALTILKVLNLEGIPEPADMNIEVFTDYSEYWTENYCRLNNVRPEDIEPMRRILQNIIPQKFFITLYCNGEAAACGLGVLENSHIGLFDIIVDSRHRRKGLGEQLILNLLKLGKENGASKSYLQVMANNEPAVSLYSKIGFKECYRYWYRTKQ